jgi:hypothetical protein
MDALSCYYADDLNTGYRTGYVAKVMRTASQDLGISSDAIPVMRLRSASNRHRLCSLGRKFVLCLGQSVVSVRNERFDPVGARSETGPNVPGLSRERVEASHAN